MLITPIGNYPAAQVAQGQFYTQTVQFQSSEALTGKLIRFTPALYLSSIVEPTSHLFELTFPAVTGVYNEMTLVGLQGNGNYKAAIKTFDNYLFEITYSFFVIPTVGGYVPDNFISNEDFHKPYSGATNLGMHVGIDNDSAYVAIPLLIEEWCASGEIYFKYKVGGLTSDGYTPDEDLEVIIGSTSSYLSSVFYVGFYAESYVGNNQNIIDDLQMHYAEVGGGVNGVPDPLGTNLPLSAFIDSSGFQQLGQYQGRVTIDGSNFTNGCYRLFVVYKEGSTWKSCISDPICKKGVDYCIYGDISVDITDALGNTGSGDSVLGLSEYLPVSVKVYMDKTTYTSKLTALGLTGTFDNTIVKIESDVVGYSTVNNEYNFTISPNGVASKKIVLVTFYFEVEGVEFSVTKEVILNFGAPDSDLAGEVQDSSTNPISVLCSESDDTYTFVPDTAIVGSFELVSNVNGGTYGGSYVNDSFELDSSILEVGDVVCVKIVQAGTVEEEPCVCPECPQVSFQLLVGQGALPDERDFILTVQGSGTLTMTESISGETATGTGTISITIDITTVTSLNFVLEYEDSEGCLYSYTRFVSDLSNLNALQILEPFNILTPIIPDCDCDEVDPQTEDECHASNSSDFQITCEPKIEKVTIDVSDSFASTVAAQSAVLQIDGVSTPIASFPHVVNNESHMLVYRTVQFTDECPDLYMQEYIECIPPLPDPVTGSLACDYSALTVTCAYDVASKEFSITKGGDDSDLIVDDLEFSLNGSPFIPYTGAVQGTGLFLAKRIMQISGCEILEITCHSSVIDDPQDEFYQLFDNFTGTALAITQFDLPHPSIWTEDEINARVQVYVEGVLFQYKASPTEVDQWNIDIANNEIDLFMSQTNKDVQVFRKYL